MVGNDDEYANGVIFCFKSLLEQLPTNKFEAKKIELTTRFIQSFLQPLFEDKKRGIYLRWTNAQIEEYKKAESSTYSNKRPDGCITLKFCEDIIMGFIEVKEEKYKNDQAKLNKDLNKLGIFSRNAIVGNIVYIL